ncbi:MAG: hypothetical protein AAGC70_00435 [Pseudomonadota bacterium]
MPRRAQVQYAAVFASLLISAVAVALPSLAAESRDRPGQWPKSLDEFLAGNYLKRADIVLTARRNDLVSYVIRWSTQSLFSHAAIVFTSPQYDSGVSSTFVIEAGTNGVDLTDIREFSTDKNSIVAIKRLNAEWFDAETRSRVRGTLLDNIKSEYNYGAVARLARNVWFGIERTFRGGAETVERFKARRWSRPNTSVLSGLIQIGFVEAIAEGIQAGRLPPSALKAVLFTESGESGRLPQLDESTDPELTKWFVDHVVPSVRSSLASSLEGITPEDLARSEKLAWQYVIRNGQVHRVSSLADVQALTK